MELHSLKLGQAWDKKSAMHKIKAWKGRAKSASITRIRRYNYAINTRRRNYFDFDVTYFSTATAGKYRLT